MSVASRVAPPEPSLSAVATVLTPAERAQVDAAGVGLYRTLHRESLGAVFNDLRTRRVDAVLLSVARCDAHETRQMAAMVREFPRIPALALLAPEASGSEHMPGAVLALGQSGVSRVIDVRRPAGWRELRSILLADHGDAVRRMALAQLSLDLAGAPADCWQFMEAIWTLQAPPLTVRALARSLGVLPSTLMSRFVRAGLPTPKQYIAFARLVRAARLFENAGYSIARVATHLDYSSPQSFGRHVRALLQLTAGEFRRRYDGEGMLHRFREELVLRHIGALRTFRPIAAMPGWFSAPSAAPRQYRRASRSSVAPA
ncbi:MAG: helix-turn-helix domain-containing protein [Gemmatimonadaceae bacterium]|nr:helix-turn-helix domain-containing protein [Gemmatimonadaceae bacterium]